MRHTILEDNKEIRMGGNSLYLNSFKNTEVYIDCERHWPLSRKVGMKHDDL